MSTERVNSSDYPIFPQEQDLAPQLHAQSEHTEQRWRKALEEGNHGGREAFTAHSANKKTQNSDLRCGGNLGARSVRQRAWQTGVRGKSRGNKQKHVREDVNIRGKITRLFGTRD
uniref:Uncharacterized protein n=1 Tax=Knipowitschia caucasica TaxID=637954 RepID=A0AAV2KU19_KNICA